MQITRRKALLGIASIPATVAPGAALAVAAPLTTYERVERLDGLAKQTADAFDAWNEYFGGKWELRIRAAADPHPIIFHNVGADRREAPAEKVQRLRRELVEASKALYPEVHDWRVITPESAHCGDKDSIVGMFMIVGHPGRARS